MTDEPLPYSAAGPNNPWLIAMAVSIATFMEVLDTTIANVSLRHIAGSLAASEDESTYILTSYLVSNAIVVPISGWLATVIGRKRFYMICVGLFTASSVLCATSTTLWQMIFWRVMQGFGGGGLAPVEQSIFADTFPLRLRPQAFAVYGFTVVLAPAIGPTLGGWLTDAYSWHWVFLINLPVGCLSLVLTWLLVYDSPALKRDRAALLKRGLHLDYFGFTLVALGFGSLQIMLDRFEREDGFSSPLIITCAAISLVSLATLMVWEFYHPQPVMNVRLFRYRSFSVSCILMFGVGFTLITSTQLLPQLSQSLMGYDATTAGLTLGLAGIATIFIMPLSGALTGRVLQPRVLSSVAFAGSAYALWYAAHLDLDASFHQLSMARLLQAIWLPFLFIPISSASLVQVPAAQNGNAAAILNLMRNLGGSIGVSFITNLLAWRSQFHQERLTEHITAYNGFANPSALPQIMQRIDAQGGMLTYIDLFLVLALAAAIMVPIALLLPKLPKGAVAAH
ncbi:MAG TPA: DHA2 family efflux MFS transporter permease subunit [Acetobacteraceae bacterium]|nr:DHA2 family efflux MFS transporter permease subunit [Acetobacteraceae bacterium]